MQNSAPSPVNNLRLQPVGELCGNERVRPLLLFPAETSQREFEQKCNSEGGTFRRAFVPPSDVFSIPFQTYRSSKKYQCLSKKKNVLQEAVNGAKCAVFCISLDFPLQIIMFMILNLKEELDVNNTIYFYATTQL